MSQPNLIRDLTNSLRSYKTQLDSANQQLAHLEKQEKIAQLTAKELDSYPTEEVWRSCGRTFILQDKSKYMADLEHDEGIINDQKKNLTIKQKYLETSVEKVVDNLKQFVEKESN
ncbi:similar to Saccharomyces cerevisiae YJL179W PFD1 Subunit of heterohexameric prefoldin, which binds cytosolic chaperonin and transfers target proteins to it [Maudiozyma barnettii]|uniref:Similar to Saccharomyces cerevisiae YJL179W PFD1 Subunit of heterohexameric prefoldin, which binds cytosolic chaperonin and transfers target proteins to it n=1 Tax=Maudiozyma barnettii TaxID=61262 RepID=A0A8H2ZGK9_9SACH|nr:prefolding complex chaperone subunit [Kazachstania barnettii]CAB4254709.1 similar to Saccharomyces cerevisiae YJL179W PFD1 Subunit of heterohexameric prefoldin, which binds cytosolic chaperonin and transfers target proteins to it [Kazachstania barnettii]CAD1782751.1 similar to Saccharomyces cerevisiae YJL179W PFD1 Subunit of heterohexameric prefoldin, which binds cytosolic chaperonin and transfers target proteins to it [Kazachstania barnettii]